jgi:hypothetical protein
MTMVCRAAIFLALLTLTVGCGASERPGQPPPTVATDSADQGKETRIAGRYVISGPKQVILEVPGMV